MSGSNGPVALEAASNRSTEQHDAALVSALDIAFQDAVKRNDAETIDEILHERFALVLGDGTIISREDVLEEARSGAIEYEIQDEEPGTHTVRVWGDTAVVTAKLWIKGRKSGASFERRVWFSDTYVPTAEGWRYAFAQVALPSSAPNAAAKSGSKGQEAQDVDAAA